MLYDIRHIKIPFRFQYGHRLKQHRGVEAIICKLEDEDGRQGWGEAVPRDYVTGETCDSVLRSIQSLAQQTSAKPASLDALIRQRIEFSERWEGAFPSCALCALDIARSDLWSSQSGLRMANWLGGESATAAHNYCASIGFGRGWKGRVKLAALAALYKRLGFQRVKVKVGNDDDEARMRFLRNRLGPDVSIFADANTAWDRETAAARIEMLAEHGVWAIEEPLQFARQDAAKTSTGQLDRLALIDDEHLENLRWLRARSPLPIIADESLICLPSMRRLLECEAVDLFNIRLSKCGGPLLSKAMVRYVQARRPTKGLGPTTCRGQARRPTKGLGPTTCRGQALPPSDGFAVAAMVGETPILASAGAHFAAHTEAIGAAPRYVQGYSHRLLHRTRFAAGEPKLRRATATLSARPGLGLTVDESLLDAITCARVQFKV